MTKTKKLATCAMLIAMATALALISKVFPLELPFGGSVTFGSMLPIVLCGYMFGTKWGLGSAFVYSIIQMILGAKTVSSFFMPGDSQMFWVNAVLVCLIDYVLAYTVLGFSGIFAKKIQNTSGALCLGSVVALVLRYLCHIVSGAIFFGTWAEWFFSEAGAFGEWVLSHISGTSLALFYSVVYNGLYMIPEIILTAALAFILSKVLKKYIRVVR